GVSDLVVRLLDDFLNSVLERAIDEIQGDPLGREYLDGFQGRDEFFETATDFGVLLVARLLEVGQGRDSACLEGLVRRITDPEVGAGKPLNEGLDGRGLGGFVLRLGRQRQGKAGEQGQDSKRSKRAHVNDLSSGVQHSWRGRPSPPQYMQEQPVL